MDTASRIRIARVEAGLSQGELAERCNMTQGSISRIESGKVAPNARTVDRIMAAIESVAGPSKTMAALDGRLGIRGAQPGQLRPIEPLGDAPPIEWLVSGLVARGAVTIVAGAPGAGKSMLSQAIAVAMVNNAHTCDPAELDGEPCGCAAVLADDLHVMPGRVAVVDAENGEHLIHRRLRAMGLLEDRAHMYHVYDAEGFDVEADLTQLYAITETNTPDLLILDSWASLWSGSEASVDGVKRCLNGLRELARTRNLGVLLIHHTTKGADTYRGSGAVAGTVEAVFTFTRDEDAPEANTRLLNCEKLRLDAEPKTRRLVLTGHGVYGADSM